MKRRTFLQSSLAAATLPVLLDNVYARPSTPLKLLAQMAPLDVNDKILILVQLFGGNDGLNTIVPAEDPNYYSLRPNINIQKNFLINRGGSDGFYMNPGLGFGDKQGFAGMFDMGQLAIIRGIGYDPPNLSHFRSTDIWLSGINDSNANDALSNGWLGRFLEQQYPNFPSQLPTDPLAINFGGFSLALTSDKGRMGIEVANPSLQAGGLSSTDDSLDDQAAGTRYATEYAFVQSVSEMSNTYATRVTTAYSSGLKSLKGNYGEDGFSQQMKSVAALIAGGLNTRVYVVGMGGFDTHVQQTSPDGTGTGAQSNLLGQLADAIAQFQSDMVLLGSSYSDRVVGFTVSEFGRRPHDNNSNGTDHGAASVQFAFGSKIAGGVFGHPPDLANLDANGDLDVQIDFRSVYQTLLTDWFGMSATDAVTVLENQNDLQQPLSGLIKPPSGVNLPAPLSLSFSIYPNPMVSRATLSIELPRDGFTQIEMASMDGKNVQSILARSLAAGSYSIPLSTELPSGTYLLSLRTGNDRIATVVEIIR
jgi:uncharacterized protein (DUF1501 family)